MTAATNQMAGTTRYSMVEYRNPTDRGNVAAMRVIIDETPAAPSGPYHVSLRPVTRDGRESTRAGRYASDMGDAQSQADEWSALAVKAGLIETHD